MGLAWELIGTGDRRVLLSGRDSDVRIEMDEDP